MSSAKANQVMQIDPPQDLVFKGPFTDVVTSHLVLSNPTDRQLCFKVKTTAPKQYCVRPNSGLIPAKGQVKVAVMLQPFDYNAEEKSKHKFMIQTAFVPDGETSLENIWKNTSGDALMDSKLKVLFEIPEVNNVDNKTPAKQTPQKVVNVGAAGGIGGGGGGGSIGGGGGVDADLRRYQNENKGLQGKVHQLEAENEQLRARLSRSESSSQQLSQQRGVSKHQTSGAVQGLPSEFKMLHVAIAALVAMVLGLIFGKVF